jgi:uncharacterized protein (TIGR02145 family)
VGANPLGVVSFRTDATWTVGNQTWSDVVMAAGCKKTDFDGGVPGGYLADCRQNADEYGDLFSWKAVDMYAGRLCPEDWRVPTLDDYLDLDKTFSQRDNPTVYKDPEVFEKYMTDWGGELGGYAMHGTGLVYQGELTCYWSLSEKDPTPGGESTFAYSLYLYFDGSINPYSNFTKNNGFPVRCVK